MKAINGFFSISMLFIFQNIVLLWSLSQLTWYEKVILTAICFSIYFIVNIVPNREKKLSARLKILKGGQVLLLKSAVLCILQILLYIMIAFFKVNIQTGILVVSIIMSLICNFVLTFNGTLRILFSSLQLGVVRRVVFIMCWWVPIINILLLINIYGAAKDEYKLEKEKNKLNEQRKEYEVCSTKYPIVMIHGVFFRDTRYFNYWGRIPRELIKNGATIYYGSQQSALTVEKSAQELKNRILAIINETNCGKVNIIAHSKGGLDARYAISCLGMDRFVASLTTINTPHKGCSYADYLLSKLPQSFINFIALKYNNTLMKLGEKSPDFYGAVCDLTVKRCTDINDKAKDMPGVVYQSVASKLKNMWGAKFPLNITYMLAKKYDGENDGLVSVDSASWGRVLYILEPQTRCGISHGDVIDLNRENIKGFDVCELYVNILKDLKKNNL